MSQQHTVPTTARTRRRARSTRPFVSIALLGAAVLTILLAPTDIGQWAAAALVTVGGVLALHRPDQRAMETVVHDLAEALRASSDEHVDLTRKVRESGTGTPLEAAQLFNRFLGRLQGVLEEERGHNLQVGFAAAYGRKLAEKARSDAERQEQQSELVFTSNDETSTALDQVSERANLLSDVNSRNLGTARSSLENMKQVAEQIAGVSEMMEGFQSTVERLVTTSEDIRGILATVQGFAGQTNMLALNAAIEAARAGEHGGGFAVVADEVRGLSAKVRGAAEEIDALLEQMSGAVANTTEGTRGVIDRAAAAREIVQSSAEQFERMVEDFGSSHQDLLLVSSAIEQLSVTNKDSLKRSTEISELGSQIHRDMDEAFKHADIQRNTSNLALQQLSYFRIGRGALEKVIDTVVSRRDAMQEAMERLADEGVDFTDRNFVPIPNSFPPKHEVSYARPMQEACGHLLDEWWENKLDGELYTVVTSDDGYMPVNRNAHARPETGDKKVDFIHSRYMVFAVTDEVQLNNIRKARYVGIGSFVMPSGAVVMSFYAPIHVRGHRYGVMSMGLGGKAFDLTVT